MATVTRTASIYDAFSVVSQASVILLVRLLGHGFTKGKRDLPSLGYLALNCLPKKFFNLPGKCVLKFKQGGKQDGEGAKDTANW